jgi:Rha family phage regulatory protein
MPLKPYISMADLVFQNSNGNDVTTSLIVAQVFGKEHKNVVRDIENLSCSENFNRLNFERITYKDARNREQTAYEMTKDGFSFLVMGYTGAKAGEFKERFINEFNRRESLLKDDDYILMRSQQILQKRLEASEEKIKQLESQAEQQQETIELQQQELTQSAPKVSYYDNHLQSVNTQTSTQAAKQIGMDAEKLHKKLKEIGIIYRQSGQWILHAPYSTWGMHSTRTQTYTRSDGSIGTSVYTVWTQRGVRFIIALYENGWNVKKAIKQIKGELNPAA